MALRTATARVLKFETVKVMVDADKNMREELGFGFARDARRVYCQDQPLQDREGRSIEGIRVSDFRALSSYLATDGARIYARNFKYFRFTVVLADTHSFRLLSESYAVDAKHVYFQDRLLQGASPDSFRLLDQAWGRDENLLFYCGKRIRNADVQKLNWVGQGKYLTDGARVWYEGREVDGADPSTFVCADDIVYQGAATDRSRPYRYGLADDPGPREQWGRYWSPFFVARPELRDYWWHKLVEQTSSDPDVRELGGGFRVVGKQVYLNDLPLLEPDAATTSLLGDSFITDDTRLYSYAEFHRGVLEGGVLAGIPAQWRRLQHGWYRTDTYCYRKNWHGNAESAKIDADTFEVLSEAYARDRSGVLCELKRMRGVDPQDVECIGSEHLRSKGRLFHFGTEVKARFDPASAESLGHGYVRDSQGRLLKGRQACRSRGFDPATLRILSRYFAKDMAHVYAILEGEFVELPNVEPNGFSVDRPDIGNDGSRLYDYNELLNTRRHERNTIRGPERQSQSRSTEMFGEPIYVVDWAWGSGGQPNLILAGVGFCQVWDLKQRRILADVALPHVSLQDPDECATLSQIPRACAADELLSLLAVTFHNDTTLYLIDLVTGATTSHWRSVSGNDEIERLFIPADVPQVWARIRNRVYRLSLDATAAADVIDYEVTDQRWRDAPLVVSADRQRYAFAKEKAVLVRDFNSGDARLPGTVSGLPQALSRNGARLLALGAKGELREFDVERGKRIALYRGGWCGRDWFRSVSTWLDGRPIFVGIQTSERRWVEVWDALDDRLVCRIGQSACQSSIADGSE
ncbi:hypothetical protein PIN31115_01042 [Pandoraea iniqua]|uniref:DKNYY family protein n=1 Tax=Pandoraea iniqua TaxID=2508288 RepID=A0A5E4SXW6_9BURK|nr:DKNYY domain-containing protein [Pandoraea iniqua]VVD79583.1 hypothetical protein PIN31115_01042 [Pandoraea iniqua]